MTPAPALIPDQNLARKWQRKPEARPEEVLDAALDLFISRGYAATRMEDIASAAGLSKAAVYLYFPSKEALFQTLVSTRLVPIRARLQDAASAAGDDPVQALRAIARVWTLVMSDARLAAIPLIVMGEAARFPDVVRYYHDEVTERVLAIIGAIYEAGVKSGQLRPFSPRAAARALISPLVLDVWRRQAFAGLDEEHKPALETAEDVFGLFFYGVAMPNSATPETTL
jgi:AcrR family transcriptional regulator